MNKLLNDNTNVDFLDTINIICKYYHVNQNLYKYIQKQPMILNYTLVFN